MLHLLPSTTIKYFIAEAVWFNFTTITNSMTRIPLNATFHSSNGVKTSTVVNENYNLNHETNSMIEKYPVVIGKKSIEILFNEKNAKHCD